jgi:hypothetical protein
MTVARIFRDEDLFVKTLGLVVRTINEETDEKLRSLEARLLEFAYRGQWVENRQYRRGNFVTLGSVWHAAVDTRSKPGTDSDWTLVIPKPRDGADGKDGKDAPPADTPAQRAVHSGRASTDVVTRRR